jgi:hypothetical protein
LIFLAVGRFVDSKHSTAWSNSAKMVKPYVVVAA